MLARVSSEITGQRQDRLKGGPIDRQKLTKHERYVHILSHIVKSSYDEVHFNVPVYSKRNRLVGEIDLMGVKGKQCDIYEVKCSWRISKAKRQLRKIRNNLHGYSVKDSFFFCGSSRALIAV